MLNERGQRLQAHVRIAAALPAEHAQLREWLNAAIARRRSGDGELSYAEAEVLIDRARQSLEGCRPR